MRESVPRSVGEGERACVSDATVVVGRRVMRNIAYESERERERDREKSRERERE